VKTNRRDAAQLARLLRAGEMTSVWIPDEGHEAMRELVRARDAAVMLRYGRTYAGKKTWVPGTGSGYRHSGSSIRRSNSCCWR
jgi:transposase